LSLLTACCAMLAGCAHLDYPAEWAPPAPTTERCADLSGNYAEDGTGRAARLIGQAPDEFHVKLSYLFLTIKSPDATHLSLAGPKDGHLDVSLWRGKRWLDSRTLSEGQNYRCEAGIIVITTGDSGSDITSSGAVVTVAIKRTSRLVKARDGALLIHQNASGGAGLFFVPFVPVADEAWDRFVSLPAPEHQP